MECKNCQKSWVGGYDNSCHAIAYATLTATHALTYATPSRPEVYAALSLKTSYTIYGYAAHVASIRYTAITVFFAFDCGVKWKLFIIIISVCHLSVPLEKVKKM